MKKIGVFILNLFAVLLVGNFGQANDYEYTNLVVNADVKVDGTIDVKEEFDVSFFENKHGIIRNIPLNYSVDGQDFHIDISDVYVQGNNFTTKTDNGIVEIKIGDVDKTVNGEQVYLVSYSTYGLVKNFGGMGYSELYWNIVGLDNDANINSTMAEIILPRKVSFNSDDFLITVNGKKNSVWDFGGNLDWSQGDRIIVKYNKILYPGEGITLAIKFPSDYFEFNHDRQSNLMGSVGISKTDKKKFGSFSKSFLYIVGFFVFFFGLMYVSKNLLNKKIRPVKVGKYFDSKYPVIVQYSPPKGMNSAEAGVLFNCRVDPIDMTSLFYQWADNKLLNISYEMDPKNPKEIQYITFTKKNDISESCPFYERELFGHIFKDKKTRVVDRTTDLAKILSLEGLEDYGVLRHWFFRRKISFVRGFFYTLLYILLLVLFFYCFSWIGILFWLFLVPIFFGLAFKFDNKIRLTEEGGKLATHVIGYAKFINDCDENLLKTFVKEDPLFIDKTLPYAVAFGMETEFMKKVTPLLKDIEQTWLRQKTYPTFPVLDITDFMRNIITDKRILGGVVKSGLSSFSSGGKLHESSGEFGKGFRLGRRYTKFRGFRIGSIFSGRGIFFKRGGGGGGGGSKSL